MDKKEFFERWHHAKDIEGLEVVEIKGWESEKAFAEGENYLAKAEKEDGDIYYMKVNDDIFFARGETVEIIWADKYDERDDDRDENDNSDDEGYTCRHCGEPCDRSGECAFSFPVTCECGRQHPRCMIDAENGNCPYEN